MSNAPLDAETLTPLVSADYDLPTPLECRLIRRGFNDNYLVTAADRQFVLRLYLNGKYYIRDANDFRFELDLLMFLNARGVHVARPIANRRGELLSVFAGPHAERYAALFEYAPGEPLSGSIGEAQARELGLTVARLHDTAAQFQGPYHRYHLDERFLLLEPARLIAEHVLADDPGADAAFRDLVQQLRAEVDALPRELPAYSLIHADLNFGNIYAHPETGITLIDFDHCAYGWRAYDVAAFQSDRTRDVWPVFLHAYESIRPLTAGERAAFPSLRAARQIWDIGDVLAMMSAWERRPGESFFTAARETIEQLLQSPPTAGR